MRIELSRIESADLRLHNQDRRGAGFAQIFQTLGDLQRREYGGTVLPAQRELLGRLAEIKQGREVPVVVFNCIDFTYSPDEDGTYPRARIIDNANKSITEFYKQDLREVMKSLQKLGNPRFYVIVPDSEIFDERAFNFADSQSTRIQNALNLKAAVSQRLLPLLSDVGGNVMLWSEYCEEQGLKHPSEYTTIVAQQINTIPEWKRSVSKKAKDSPQHYERAGMDPTYTQQLKTSPEVLERSKWYLAMYGGEGLAMQKSRAICLNLENDGRVTSWYQRGAANILPMITPVDVRRYTATKR